MIPITEHMSYKRMLLRGTRDLINLSHFDPIIRMIPLSGAHCILMNDYDMLIFAKFYTLGSYLLKVKKENTLFHHDSVS
jgi:hypothetical protein